MGNLLCATETPNTLTLICDLDGTLLPKPHKNEAGVLKNPTLREGAAFAPIERLLNDGGTIYGVTGSKLSSHKPRFWDDLPLSARCEGRVLLFCETGMSLFRPNEEGEPVEDESYGPFPGNTKRYLPTSTVNAFVAAARAAVRQWFQDLKADPALLDAGHWLIPLADRWADEDAPLSHDPKQTPRIEVRGDTADTVVGVMVAGVPIQYGAKYLTPCLIPGEIEGVPTGRLCFDAVVPGLNKKLVLDWLLREKVIDPKSGAVVCFGDSPGGNDAGLTAYHMDGIPFVSVCEHDKKVPEPLMPWHTGHNERGSGATISRLADLQKERKGKAGPIVNLNTLNKIVDEARASL